MRRTSGPTPGGALTGAAFNLARARGPIVATGKFNDAWLSLVAPIVGAIQVE